MALSKLHLCGLVWEAWTDFGTVCAGRTAALRKSDRFSQGLGHPRVDPPTYSKLVIDGLKRRCRLAGAGRGTVGFQ